MTRILLDSHAFVWFLTGDRRCSKRVRESIETPESVVFVSAVTAWETAAKVRLGKWPEAAPIARSFDEVLEQRGFVALSITVTHSRTAGSMPWAHRGPFDRMLAAQAKSEDLLLITADPAFRHFDVKVLW